MTIRFKLMVSAVAIILVVNVVLCLVGFRYLSWMWMGEVQARVRLDLRSAETAYEDHVRRIETFLRGVSLDEPISRRSQSTDGAEAAVRSMMDRIFAHANVDFLTLLDPEGQVRYRPHNPDHHGDSVPANALIRQALESQEPISGTVLLSADCLRAEKPSLAERATIELLPTAAAKPARDTQRDEGLVVAAVVPLFSADGMLTGFLYAGDLLTRRSELVDAIKRQVFFGEAHRGRDIGTVTIFQHDLRIATNVLDARGQRAVGTRMSQPVYETVLKRGEIWAAPAFVVNDWYITAYKPIRNPDHDVIGALYVGLWQAPFLAKRNMVAVPMLGAMLLGTTLTLVLLYVTMRWGMRPIERILEVCRRVTHGDLEARVGVRPPGEIGTLCEAVDSMAEAIQRRQQKLQTTTQKQIFRSEKLASIGRLAAGIAHEINNPLTGVLTFAHLIRDRQGEQGPDREDLDLIIQETQRTADIVRGLLDFARERTAEKKPLDINDVIRTMVRLVEHQKNMRQIHIEQTYGENLPSVVGDKNQLQQVLLNLILNAAEAMDGRGSLEIATGSDDEHVIISVADTGGGILPEDIDRIFDPFFSTKPVGKGTGLGLSVSYGIIEQHQGTIDVSSEVGVGSEFVVRLPVAGSEGSGIIHEQEQA